MAEREQVWGPSYSCAHYTERKLIVSANVTTRDRARVGALFGMAVYVDQTQPDGLLTLECGQQRISMRVNL